MTRLRYLFLVLFGFVLSHPAMLQARRDACSSICGPTADCGEFCEDYGSCGNFDGGASGGWCAGDCGDGYCNSAISEDYVGCPEDCGYCGDGICDSVNEGSSCHSDCDPMPYNIPGPECDPTNPVETCPANHVCLSDGFCASSWEACASAGTCLGDCCYYSGPGGVHFFYCC